MKTTQQMIDDALAILAEKCGMELQVRDILVLNQASHIIFSYDSKAYLEFDDIAKALTGNFPIVLPIEDGCTDIYQLTPVGLEKFMVSSLAELKEMNGIRRIQ